MCAEVAVETPTQFSMEGAMAAKFHFSGQSCEIFEEKDGEACHFDEERWFQTHED